MGVHKSDRLVRHVLFEWPLGRGGEMRRKEELKICSEEAAVFPVLLFK